MRSAERWRRRFVPDPFADSPGERLYLGPDENVTDDLIEWIVARAAGQGVFADVPAAFGMIFKGAFGIESAAGGIVGAMLNGIKRGLFSNEAGQGSAPG